jgi:hypothetical protein
MNVRKQKYPVVLIVVVVISSFLILTASFGGTMIFRTTAGQQEDQQNAINSTNPISNQTNGIANQSGPVVESIENQTVANQTGTATLLANLTQSDFETLSQDLTEASQTLENNDTNTVLDELDSASGELF